MCCSTAPSPRRAGNPFMISTLDHTWPSSQGATRVTRANEARRTDFADAVTHEHTHIVRAIEAGDPVAASGCRGAAHEERTGPHRAGRPVVLGPGRRLAQPLVAASAPLVF